AGGNVALPAQRTTTTQLPFGQATQSTQQAASVLLLPLPRVNAILLAAPRLRIADIEKEIKNLDVPNSPRSGARAFPLKTVPASRMVTVLTNFYNTRYSPETLALNQIRFTADDKTN